MIIFHKKNITKGDLGKGTRGLRTEECVVPSSFDGSSFSKLVWVISSTPPLSSSVAFVLVEVGSFPLNSSSVIQISLLASLEAWVYQCNFVCRSVVFKKGRRFVVCMFKYQMYYVNNLSSNFLLKQTYNLSSIFQK